MKPIRLKLEREREAHEVTKKELDRLRDVLGAVEELLDEANESTCMGRDEITRRLTTILHFRAQSWISGD